MGLRWECVRQHGARDVPRRKIKVQGRGPFSSKELGEELPAPVATQKRSGHPCTTTRERMLQCGNVMHKNGMNGMVHAHFGAPHVFRNLTLTRLVRLVVDQIKTFCIAHEENPSSLCGGKQLLQLIVTCLVTQ